MANPMSSRYRLKTINIYEEWRPMGCGRWQEYRVCCYSDGSASSVTLRGPISEAEYFKLKLAGKERVNPLEGWTFTEEG